MILSEMTTLMKSLKNIFNIINGNKDYYNPKIDLKRMTIILMVKDYFLRIFNYIWCSFEGISFVEYLTTEYEVKGLRKLNQGLRLQGTSLIVT